MVAKVIPIVGEINAEVMAQFTEAFQKMDRTPGSILVQISSNGGSVDFGGAMYELMRTSQNQIITVGLGEVASIAVLLLMAGDHRIITEGTTILIHDGNVNVDASLLKAKAYMDESTRLHQWYCEQVADRSGLSLKQVLSYASSETFLPAAKALELGLVDEVRPYRKLKPLKLKK